MYIRLPVDQRVYWLRYGYSSSYIKCSSTLPHATVINSHGVMRSVSRESFRHLVCLCLVPHAVNFNLHCWVNCQLCLWWCRSLSTLLLLLLQLSIVLLSLRKHHLRLSADADLVWFSFKRHVACSKQDARQIVENVWQKCLPSFERKLCA